MAWNITAQIDYEDKNSKELRVKIICIGEKGVGKSTLMKRFFRDDYKLQELSTDQVTIYRYPAKVNKEKVIVDFWDIAGQEKFKSLHPTYYIQAHSIMMLFDVTRKNPCRYIKYWYKEIRSHRRCIPVFCVANKIDANKRAILKVFRFPHRYKLPVDCISALKGTEVVKLMKKVIREAVLFRKNPSTHHRIRLIEVVEKM